MKKIIEKLKNRTDLSSAEIERSFEAITSPLAKSEDIKEFLLALNEKGPSIEEITGAAKFLRKALTPVKTKHKAVLDTCGTGGDGRGTFNISTVAALVVAGCGVVVAKHGNRGVSSKCGSADVLEALGVNLNLDERALGRCLDENGIVFLFAQKLHPAMKNVAPVRKELGTKTIFNILGPLANPAKATHQMMGVYDAKLVEPLANVLKNLGLKRAIVVCSKDGLDEISLSGETFVSEFSGREIKNYTFKPEDVGMSRLPLDALKGGDIRFNANILESILKGVKGPPRDVVLLNSAFALYAAGKVSSPKEGIKMAEQSIDSGKALEKLNALRGFAKNAQ